MSIADIFSEVGQEIEKAVGKSPTWSTDPIHEVCVLGEEYGEKQYAVLQLTYEPHESSKEDVRMEAIQTAAIAIRFIASLDSYMYSESKTT